ncbi:MAG: hypothetical protein KGL39_41130 [Patescibacteria group bacterium]|nr:hypothetical protein [Patescibacteria group bacterium]
MCKAFSCIVDQVGKVTWKLGVDSHRELAEIGGYEDRVLGEFAKVEISPKNGDYLNPDEWVYRVDESPVPRWCGLREKELCLAAHKKWLAKLEKYINRHPIVHPFKVTPPSKITKAHISLLRKWDSVWDSVGDSIGDSIGGSVRNSVWDSVGDSIGDSVRNSAWGSVWDSFWDSIGGSVRNSFWDSVGGSVRNSVWDSIGGSVRDSVWDSVRNSAWGSVWAYLGSFFKIPVWKYVEHPKGKYPYQPLVSLWNKGLVPSFDGNKWRLHGGPKGEILFTITAEDLRKGKK